jgi:hypothetical protein
MIESKIAETEFRETGKVQKESLLMSNNLMRDKKVG